MNKLKKIDLIREKLKSGQSSIGSWIQLPHPSIAEIMGDAGYDWIAVDLEHGSIDVSQLPNLFRALELGGTLPLARIAQGHSKDCKRALDAGAAGVIVPMIESAEHLEEIRDACYWPPAGNRGVGFSRANGFGKYFTSYSIESQSPILVAMIENYKALDSLEDILKVKGLDAIFIGPYHLSASMGIVGQFENSEFKDVMERILQLSKKNNIPCGSHIVIPDPLLLNEQIKKGFQFIAYSIDSVFLTTNVCNPKMINSNPNER
jgi:2-dehydro-3-deoxyglucarate aldolase